jgi:hypothetical protein
MNARQLALIAEVVSLCEEASIPCWLRGGWAMDFFLGCITREHEDIDLFVWAKDAPMLVRVLEHTGFREVGGPPLEAQRDFVKDGEELQVALLAQNERGEVVVAGGPWAGTPHPEGMLVHSIGRLGDVACPIVNPRVQLTIKEQFPGWVGLPMSEKHRSDIAHLRRALGFADEQLQTALGKNDATDRRGSIESPGTTVRYLDGCTSSLPDVLHL